MMLTVFPGIASIAFANEIETTRHAPSARQQCWKFCAERVLGTRLEVLIHSQSREFAELAARAARREIERLNLVFNHRREDSEISALNRVRHINASGDLFAVAQLGEVWRRITRGAFDGRMGALLQLWTGDGEPRRLSIDHELTSLRDSIVALDPIERSIALSSQVTLSLDAIAKGYIVDAALNAACRAVPNLDGIALSIGGDIRCWGKSPDSRGWRIGISDPTIPADNAPLVDAVALDNGAIATSGRGPRDRTRTGYRSTTISPLTGQPVRDVISASVVASHAADADAIATACMVLEPTESIALVDRLDGVAARITDATGRVHASSRWPRLQIAVRKTPSNKISSSENQKVAISSSNPNKNPLPPEQRWPADWEIGITYIEPDYKDQQRADFTTPFIAVWITDAENHPVNTVFMLGTAAKWHRDNFIWWESHRERAEQLVDLHSQATTLSGRYQIYWPGVDEDWKPVPIGKYIVHLETSQEHGKHTYRSVPIEIGRERFKMTLPILKNEGGLEISYGHYNDRFKD